MIIDKKTYLSVVRAKDYASVMTLNEYEEFINETILQGKQLNIDISREDIKEVYPIPEDLLQYIDEEIDEEDEINKIDLNKTIELKWVSKEALSIKNIYLNQLISNSFQKDNISTIARENVIQSSARILDRCTDPKIWNDESKNKQGVVIGKVQSGKTMSMMTLISMALYERYNLVIILAGSYDSLREQTQDRLNNSFNISGNSLIDSITALDEYGKSSSSWDNNILKFDKHTNKRKRTILCIKKNTKVIERLIKDLNSYYNKLEVLPNVYEDIKALIIDDEVDSVTPDNKPGKGGSPTNQAIIRLRRQIKKNSYVGYTATPQACFASDPKSIVGYPKDFVWLLDTEKDSKGNSISYLGLKEYFLQYSNFLITNLKNFDWPIYLKSEDNGKTIQITSPQTNQIIKIEKGSPKLEELIQNEIDSYNSIRLFPHNFKEACVYFILGAAIKWYRYSKEKEIDINELSNNEIDEIYPYHTMMWHIYFTKDKQNEITKIIQKIFKLIRSEYESNKFVLFNNTLNKINERTLKLNLKNQPVSLNDINIYIPHIFRILFKLTDDKNFVITLNSDQKIEQLHWHEEFDFKEDKHVKKICVFNGGHKLARGVTLQNLAVTVFTRFSTQTIGDTAMQMNRWFGHKLKYIDLCQLYIHRQVENTFKQIADADIMFRKIIKNNILNNASTESTAYKLFSNTLFRATSPNKSYFLTAEKKYDYSGEVQLLLEPVGNLINEEANEAIKTNYNIFSNWKNELKVNCSESKINHLNRADLYYDVPHFYVLELMKNLNIQEDSSSLSPQNLISYLELWTSQFNENKIDYNVPYFNIAIMRKVGNRLRTYKRKFLSDKEKSSISEMKMTASEKIIFSPFSGGAASNYLGDKFIDKTSEWHQNNKNKKEYKRDRDENMLLVFYEFDPNYIGTFNEEVVEFNEKDSGYLNPEFPILTYMVSFNIEGPKFRVLYNKQNLINED